MENEGKHDIVSEVLKFLNVPRHKGNTPSVLQAPWYYGGTVGK